MPYNDYYRNKYQEKVVPKSVNHFRLQKRTDILLRFQNRTPHIRPPIDEVEVPPTLILRYIDDDILYASNNQRRTRLEVKYIAKKVLEALSGLHNEGFVHTGMLGRLFNTNSINWDGL
jgi:hypothetical protein